MKATRARDLSRRQFLGAAAAAPFLTGYDRLAAAERKRVKIRDVQTMTMQGSFAHVRSGASRFRRRTYLASERRTELPASA